MDTFIPNPRDVLAGMAWLQFPAARGFKYLQGHRLDLFCCGMIKTVEWTDSAVVMLDQRLLPGQEIYRSCVVISRGGRGDLHHGHPGRSGHWSCGGHGHCSGGEKCPCLHTMETLEPIFQEICDVLASTRPTAVNLFWAIERMKAIYRQARPGGMGAVRAALVREAVAMHEEDIRANRAMGQWGAVLIPMARAS